MVNFIGITSGNGGMGKSSVACNIAYGLCREGKRVLLIESSFGIRSYDAILGIKSETFFSFSDYCSSQAALSDIITKPDDEHLPHFIAGGSVHPSGDVAKALSNMKQAFSKEYDYIVSDVSPENAEMFSAFLKNCDSFLILTDASFISVRNSSYLADLIRKNSKAKPNLVLNKVKIDETDNSSAIEDIIDETLCQLLGIIPYDEYFSRSVESGEPIYMYNTCSGRAMENICKRLLGADIPDFEKGASGGLFKKEKYVLKQFI